MKKQEPTANEMIQPPSDQGKPLAKMERSEAILIMRRAVENVKAIGKRFRLFLNQINENNEAE